MPDSNPQTTSSNSVQERALRVIATKQRIPLETVRPESTFDELGIDSLDRLNILFDLEGEFDIEINDEDAKRVENIPQMVAGVLALVEAKNGSAGSSAVTAASQDVSRPDGAPATKPASSGE